MLFIFGERQCVFTDTTFFNIGIKTKKSCKAGGIVSDEHSAEYARETYHHLRSLSSI